MNKYVLQRLIIFLFALITLSGPSYCQQNHQIASCCDSKRARCTGSSNCSACTNCSGCKHCNSGGSCGVCSGGSNTTYKTNNYYSGSSSSSSYNGSGSTKKKKKAYKAKTTSIEYKVISETLNIRNLPNTKSNILYTMKMFDEVLVLEFGGDSWYKIKHIASDGKAWVGYVNSNYLMVQ